METINIDTVDYAGIGLCCGLEIHQQLDTGKLFCKCRARMVKDGAKPDRIIKRKLRPVYSESGELDLTAIAEHKKDKSYAYYFYNSCNCLVEADCQPPILVNPDALRTAVIISKLTNSKLVGRSYVMRKQVLDGSNVSGFQRTMMISTDGHLDFDFGKVRIDKLLLEEDSARAIEKTEFEDTYSLDRLGIPLIELVVWHDMHTPEDTRKVAQNVGQLFRLTGVSRRGLGSIRQDINVSIRDGSRIEIKGCQELDLIPEIVKREVQRQLGLIEVKKELEKRGISGFRLKEKDVSWVFKDTQSQQVRSALEGNKKVFGLPLKKMTGILGYELQQNRRVGTEIASVLKASTTLKGLFHSDELPNYGITKEEVSKLKGCLTTSEDDAFILLLCSPEQLKKAKEVIETRLNQLVIGVPYETRLVTPQGNTEYQRPLSLGCARMYPETDILPISFTKDILQDAENAMPLSLDKRRELYASFGLSNQLIEKMVLDNYAVTFEKIISKNKTLNPTQVAVFLLEDLTTWAREGLIALDNISSDDLLEFFSYELFAKIPRQKVKDIFLSFVSSDRPIKEIVGNLNIFNSLSDAELGKVIDKIIAENRQKIQQLGQRAQGLVMGRLMAETGGNVDGQKANALVNRKLLGFLENKDY